MTTEVEEVLDVVNQIIQDPTVPKSLKETGEKIKEILNNGEGSIDLRAKKCLDLLEELEEEPNIPFHIRSQLWSLVSLLENL